MATENEIKRTATQVLKTIETPRNRAYEGLRLAAQALATGGNSVDDVLHAAAVCWVESCEPHVSTLVEETKPSAMLDGVKRNLKALPPVGIGPAQRGNAGPIPFF